MAGWLKLHRVLMDKPIWKNSTSDQKSILITLLMMANHDRNEWEFKGNKFLCQPGQFITSLESIKSNAGKGITIQKIRTALKRFEKFGFLTNESTKQSRLITIINWANYQGFDNEPNKAINSHLTNDQQTTNNQLTTNKNVKNDKNERRKERYGDFRDEIYMTATEHEIRNMILYEKWVYKYIPKLSELEILTAIERSQGKDARYLVAVLETMTKTDLKQQTETVKNRSKKPKLKMQTSDPQTLSDDEMDELRKIAETLDKGITK